MKLARRTFLRGALGGATLSLAPSSLGPSFRRSCGFSLAIMDCPTSRFLTLNLTTRPRL